MNVIAYFSRLLVLLIALHLPVLLFGAKIAVTNLKCEYLINPLGIDLKSPRLSWQIETAEQNFRQSAYEVRVAENPDQFNQKSKLVWNAGKIGADQSVNVVYTGVPLKAGQRYYWQVRIWDRNNINSE